LIRISSGWRVVWIGCVSTRVRTVEGRPRLVKVHARMVDGMEALSIIFAAMLQARWSFDTVRKVAGVHGEKQRL